MAYQFLLARQTVKRTNDAEEKDSARLLSSRRAQTGRVRITAEATQTRRAAASARLANNLARWS
jgi:hypothetical protein